MNLVSILGTEGAHHHAVCVTGDLTPHIEEALTYIEESHKVSRIGNPDLLIVETDSLSVDDARKIREKASLRAIAGEKRFFIIAFTSATQEAQNALLKLLEEPPTGAYFFILVPSQDILLPTVRSRLFFVAGESAASHKQSIDSKKFLSSSPSARLKMLEPLMKRASDEKTKPEALKEARHFVRSVTEALREDLHAKKKIPHGLSEAMRANEYLGDRSPSIKMLLEYLALSLPN